MHRLIAILVGVAVLFLIAIMIKTKKISERACYWIVFLIALAAVVFQFVFPGHIHVKWVFPAFALLCGLILVKDYTAKKSSSGDDVKEKKE